MRLKRSHLFWLQAEHKAAVLEAATDVPRLTERLAALQRQGSKRLVDSSELLASLALLDEQVASLQQDMENAGMHGGAGGEAEEARVARLAELEALREELGQVRQRLQLQPWHLTRGLTSSVVFSCHVVLWKLVGKLDITPQFLQQLETALCFW
jgi:hypothetical protein